MQGNFNLNFDDEPGVEQPFYTKTKSQNDSIGNNSGGIRSNRDDDFNPMDDLYQQKVQNQIDQQQNQQPNSNQLPQFGPSNNQNNQPQISLYDIETNLTSKNLSILNFKKTLQTIIQCLNAFQVDQLPKFVRLIVDLPGFDETFQKQNRRRKKMQVQVKQSEEGSSDVSAKSDFLYVLPSSGMQTIFQIAIFLGNLIEKCTNLDNMHLIPILREIMNPQSRFYCLPLTPQELMQESSQFVQNSNNEGKYPEIEEGIQQSYVSLFEFSNEVNSLKQIWYFFFAGKCINQCFKKNSPNYNLSTKMKIHSLQILNQLRQASPQMFQKFQFSKDESDYMVSQKNEIIKMQKQQLEEYLNVLLDCCRKDEIKIRVHLSLVISSFINVQNSIEKKSQALRIIEKLIINTKKNPQTINAVCEIIEEYNILDMFMKDQMHSQLLKKVVPIVKFLYDLNKIETSEMKTLIKEGLKRNDQFFKVVLALVEHLKLKDLEVIFEYMKAVMNTVQEMMNPHVIKMIQSVVNNCNLGVKKRKNVKKQKSDAIVQQKEQGLLTKQNPDKLNHLEPQSTQINSLAKEVFRYLYLSVQDAKLQTHYLPILCKHISFHATLFVPLISDQFSTRSSQPKHYKSYEIFILEHCLKMDMDSLVIESEEKLPKTHQIQMNPIQHSQNQSLSKTQESLKQPIKRQFIANLATNCNLYDSIFIILCQNRIDSSISDKCLNILVLTAKHYTALEKGQIQKLWKVLGRHYSNQHEEEQFFQFIREVLRNSAGLSEEAVKHIFFEILLRLTHGYFTPKIYDCLEVVFLRLNEDGGILTYESENNSQNSYYRLNNAELIGIEKFYYLYLWADSKVAKKVKDLIFKLYSFKSTPKVQQQFCFAVVQSMVQYLKRNYQFEGQLPYANTQEEFSQHVSRAFQLFAKLMDGPAKISNQKQAESSMITVTIHNVTKQALPPLKKSLEVKRNMLLKEFKELIRKQMNPEVKEIELINKGKALKAEKMSLKELKIEDKNTILVENMDVGEKKQVQEERLRECKDTLMGIFGEQYSGQLLGFVAEKYLGEQLEKICEWVMDEEKMKELEGEMGESGKRIEEEKEGVDKECQKDNDNEVQIVSLGEMLSEQILVLLQALQRTNENKEQSDKHWMLISKIPVNKKVLANLQNQLSRQHINFQNVFHPNRNQSLNVQTVFHPNRNQSLNVQTYLWLLFNASVSKIKLHFKTLIVLDPSLEAFILQRLQNLLHNLTLHPQLLRYILVAYQMILNLACAQLHQQQNPNQNQNQQPNPNHQMQPSNRFAPDPHFYIHNYSNLKLILNRLQTHLFRDHSSSHLPIQQIYSLLITYCDLITLYQNSHHTSLRPELFEEQLFESITQLIANGSALTHQHCRCRLAFVNKLIDKVFSNARITQRKLSNQHLHLLLTFVDYLFDPFIFNLKAIPILTDNGIKQHYYSILLKLADSSNELLLKICGKIIKFGVEKRNTDHDNIDFKKNSFVGIQNLGCTCYINSLVQQLYHTRLPLKLLSIPNSYGLFQLNHTFMQLFMTVKNAINIRPMIQQVKFYGQEIIPTIQQDVQEFLISLLDYIESCNGKSIIDSIFGGSYSEELTYFSEKNPGQIFKKHKQEHFYNITLDIKGKKDLAQALEYFFRSQNLDDKILCEELGEKTSVMKRSFIKHFPKILIFTLKRFQFDVENMVRKKLNDYFEFTEELDLTQFSLGKFLKDESSEKGIKSERLEEKVEIDENKEQQIGGEDSHLYMLCGILIHSGSAETGHYYSYIHREGKWYEFNDRTVTEINLPQIVKGECFGGGESRNAYMLFYEKIEPTHPTNNSKPQKFERMEIQQGQADVQIDLDKTVPLEVEESHHGIFLSQVPEHDDLKQLVAEENMLFIKERLIYDHCYRNFVSNVIPLIRQAKASNPYQTEFDKQQEYLLSDKLVQIQKIDYLINPKVEQPIVHFQSNEMMEVEMKEVTYEEEERMEEERRKKYRQSDIVEDVFNQHPQKDYI